LLRHWIWIGELEAFLKFIWQFLERIFQYIQQRESRQYALQNTMRISGYPFKNLNTGTAPVWTAYGRAGGNQCTTWSDFVFWHLAGV
jgi:hypothetical protein